MQYNFKKKKNIKNKWFILINFIFKKNQFLFESIKKNTYK